MPKEIPILFSTEMVTAILEGRKTMTRRIVKKMALEWLEKDGFTPEYVASPENDLCPYGKVGDILYVREKFMLSPNGGINYWGDKISNGYEYFASANEQYKQEWPKSWKPGIHLPKAASRIWLEVTDIRVERVLDISEEDAKAEGVLPVDGKLGAGYKYYHDLKLKTVHPYTQTAKDSFMSLWDLINGNESLHANVWVWVISFKVLSTTGKPSEPDSQTERRNEDKSE